MFEPVIDSGQRCYH